MRVCVHMRGRDFPLVDHEPYVKTPGSAPTIALAGAEPQQSPWPGLWRRRFLG